MLFLFCVVVWISVWNEVESIYYYFVLFIQQATVMVEK